VNAFTFAGGWKLTHSRRENTHGPPDETTPGDINVADSLIQIVDFSGTSVALERPAKAGDREV